MKQEIRLLRKNLKILENINSKYNIGIGTQKVENLIISLVPGRGLTNIGNSCYFNTMLQLIYNCVPELKNYLIGLVSNKKLKKTNKYDNNFLYELGLLYSEMDKKNIDPISDEILEKVWNNFYYSISKIFPRGSQQDLQEAYNYFLEILQKNIKMKYNELFEIKVLNVLEIKNPILDDQIQPIMEKNGLGDFFNTYIWEERENVRENKIEELNMFLIPATDCNSIQKCLDTLTQKEEVDRESKRFKFKCDDLEDIRYKLKDIIEGISTKLSLDLENPSFNKNIYKDNKNLYDLESPPSPYQIKNKIIGIISHNDIPGDPEEEKIKNLVLYFIYNLLKEDITENIEDPNTLSHFGILKNYISVLNDYLSDNIYLEISTKTNEFYISVVLNEVNYKHIKGATKLPKYLNIFLKRYDSERRKLDDQIVFDETINFPLTDINGTSERNVDYKIKGVGIHTGSTIKFGHYYAYCVYNKKWFVYNDDEVYNDKLSNIKKNIKKNGYGFIYEKIE